MEKNDIEKNQRDRTASQKKIISTAKIGRTTLNIRRTDEPELKHLILTLMLALFTVAIMTTISSCNNEEPLRLGIQTAPAIALPMIAYEKGFFQEEGLNVELKIFTGGKLALQALIAGSLDVATPAEVPPTLALMQGNNNFVIIAQGVEKTTNEVRMVIRGNKTTPQEFFATKRKVSTYFGGGPEFFTYNFFNYYNISPENVELISQSPQDMPAALASGSVDAIAMFDPFAYFAEKNVESYSFKNDEIYSELYVYTMSKEYISTHPTEVEKFLRGLIHAEKFLKQNPQESKEIVAKYTKLDINVLNGIWDTLQFKIVLNKRLVEYMKSEEEWARKTGKVGENATLPELSTVIETKYLKRIDPERVEI